MSSNIDSKLIQDMVVENFETVATPNIGFIKNYTLDYSAEAFPRSYLTQGIVVPVTTGGITVNTNPSDFETNSRIVSACQVPVKLYSASFAEDYNDAVPGENSLSFAIEQLAQKIGGVVLGLFTTTANGFSTTSVNLSGADTLEKQDKLFKDIYKSLPVAGDKYLIGNADLFAASLPVNKNSFDVGQEGARGFKSIYESNILAEGNLGVVSSKKAIAIANVLPQWNIEGLESVVVPIKSLGGLQVVVNKWGSLKSRATYWSVDVAFGAGIFDKNAAKVITQSK